MNSRTKNIEDENRLLEERLAKLTKLSKKIIRPKKEFYLDPVKKKDIVKQRDAYDEVESKLDYDKMKFYQINKQNKLKQRKREEEMASCTFKPRLNKKSKKMVRNVNYVRPQEKKLARKPKPDRVDSEERERETTFDEIMNQLDIDEPGAPAQDPPRTAKKKIKKINSEFYEKQLKWLNRKKQVAEKQRLENAMKEFSEVKNVPKTNRKRNEKLLGNRKKLMDRVNDETMKSKMKKEKLQKKYNQGTFKPKINRNYNVKSKVRETLDKPAPKTARKKNGVPARQDQVWRNEDYVEEYPSDENYD